MAAQRVGRILLWICLLYVWGSVLEWMLHKWTMHGVGLLGGLFARLQTTRSHIQHHRDTNMQQGLSDDYHPKGLVYQPRDMILTWLAFAPVALGLWALSGGRKAMPASAAIAFTVVAAFLYFWTWNSIHTAYHQVYLPANEEIPDPKGGEGATVVLKSPIPYFRPDKNDPVFLRLFWYHALHHLNKGVGKGNYNILLPLADVLLGSYTGRVDNRAHFAENAPATDQERWLYDHQVFDVQVRVNAVMYREKSTDVWKPLPAL